MKRCFVKFVAPTYHFCVRAARCSLGYDRWSARQLLFPGTVLDRQRRIYCAIPPFGVLLERRGEKNFRSSDQRVGAKVAARQFSKYDDKRFDRLSQFCCLISDDRQGRPAELIQRSRPSGHPRQIQREERPNYRK